MEKEESKSFKMKNAYVTQVENKYVFNLSLIFWHLFIALSTLVIVISLVIFLWSLIPASQKDVEKLPYRNKKEYPDPVKVSIAELQLEAPKEEAPPVVEEQKQSESKTVVQSIEDLTGKKDFDQSMNTLRTLIPPAKYSWQGSGYWTYPYGERYWTFYKLEKYRKWNSTEAGLEEKLNSSYRVSKLVKYTDKKILLDAFIGVIKMLPEEKRLIAIQDLIRNVTNNNSQNISVCQSLSKIINKMSGNDISYIAKLAYLGKINPNDGTLTIDYITNIIDKFDISKRSETIDKLLNGYNDYFNRNLSLFKESTDLFLPLIPQLKTEYLPRALLRYYVIFRNKNYARDNSISQIENEYQQSVNAIEAQYAQDQLLAQIEYGKDKITKTDYRIKSLAGIGGGILLIVLIAVVLVFFSILRSVKRIEDKMIKSGGNVNPMV